MFSGVLAEPDGKPMIILISRFRGHAVTFDRAGLNRRPGLTQNRADGRK